MAIKTRSELVAQIAANFPDNNSFAITPAKLREYLNNELDSEPLFEDSGNPLSFDVTITDTAAIQAMNSVPIQLVADDGGLFQLVTGTIEMNSDGDTSYDFEGYLAIVSGGGNILALTVDWTGANVATGTLTPYTIDANGPGTYNLTKVSRSDNNSGGLYLSGFGADATEGNRSIRVYGTYAKFPV